MSSVLSSLASIFTDQLLKQLLSLLGLIILQVLLAVALALKTNSFDWKQLANFYKSIVAPFVLGWLVFVIIARLASASLLGPQYSVIIGDGVTWLSWLAVVASLGARIVETAKTLYGSLLPFLAGESK
jgi:hypothetical protein